MAHEIRSLTADDQIAAWALGSIAFGYRDRAMPLGWTSDTPGRHTWGVFDDGSLVAKAVDREQAHWFGGRLVPASGVAGVATATELRGQGLSRLVLVRLLAGARDRGAAISTLFPTTPFPYRSVGWEECGALMWAGVQAASLAAVRVPKEVRVRAAVAADVPMLQELYRAMTRDGTAIMDRSGPAWSYGDYLDEYDGVSVAEDESGALIGYMSWDRQSGYDANGSVRVDDFVATNPAATRALLAVLGGWASVAPTIRCKAAGVDPALLASAAGQAPIVDRRPWMLRVVDAAAAIAARGWPSYLHGVVELELTDAECPWNAGRYRLVLDGGEGRLEAGGAGGVRFTSRGLAVWYAGAATPEVLRRAGLLSFGGGGDSGGSAGGDVEGLLRAATAGPAPQLLDYF